MVNDLEKNDNNNIYIYIIMSKLVKECGASTLIIWIPGFNNTWFHQHILNNAWFKDCDIYLMHFGDYTPYTTKDNNIPEGSLKVDIPYATEDFFCHYEEINQLLEPHMLNQQYTKYVMYGHSTGGLIASMYLIYGKYRKFFSCGILNDPFFDYNNSLLIESIFKYIHLLPISHRFHNLLLCFNKYAPITIPWNSYTMKKITDDGYNVNKWVKTLPLIPVGFITACNKHHNTLIKEETPLVNIPCLVMIADGDQTLLNTKETLAITQKSIKNYEIFKCKSCYHDACFPSNKTLLPIFGNKINNFITKHSTQLPNINNSITPIYKFKLYHNKPNIFLNIIFIFIICRLYLDKITS
uniref:Serine aminopeptidase S33 domain-containing protein n=1 Tax=Megaviridae environmental sample TaxID=1737588 RepID=A0A5J6VK21_9VIRU|nr:MAG: hypothetical protein [Megaviridae environmental sample]